jgi:hypothetical protein
LRSKFESVVKDLTSKVKKTKTYFYLLEADFLKLHIWRPTKVYWVYWASMVFWVYWVYWVFCVYWVYWIYLALLSLVKGLNISD